MGDKRRPPATDAIAPDCRVCLWRDACETAQAGTFCLNFRKEPPPDRGESPADRWARGEDVDL